MIRVWSEWDIGLENVVFASKELAQKYTAEALADCGLEESLKEYEDEGLISYEWLTYIDK